MKFKDWIQQKITYALKLQFIDRIERGGKMNSDEKHRIKDKIETKEEKSMVGDAAEKKRKKLKD